MSPPRVTDIPLDGMLRWLDSRGMKRAADALRFASEHHTGVRRGPHARPEITHQLQIMQLLRALSVPEGAQQALLTVAALHDVLEDCPVDPYTLDERFGHQITEFVQRLSRNLKVHPEGGVTDKAAYFARMDHHPVVAAVKAADRVVNQRDMPHAFTPARQWAYLEETRSFILPMLERAWTYSPAWTFALMHLHDLLTLQDDLLRPHLTPDGA